MSQTRVVNIRNASYDVYIGRTGRGQDGYFGNPCSPGTTCVQCGELHSEAGATLYCFACYFTARLASDAEYRVRIEALRGKTLGCFCKPKPCHGDIIVTYLVEGRI